MKNTERATPRPPQASGSGAWKLARGSALVALLVASSGCGGIWYATASGAASSKLDKAAELGAERSAVYEYTSAQVYYQKAKEEAAAGQYGDAIRYADEAARFAEEAAQVARRAQETPTP